MTSNLFSGVNGVECGQSIVIAVSVLINSILNLSSDCWSEHMFSLYLVCPFIGVSCAVLYYNWLVVAQIYFLLQKFPNIPLLSRYH